MDLTFFKQQALRARELAEKVDPFTRKRLLALADKYDAKAGGSTRASRMFERPSSLPLEWPRLSQGLPGEA